jgi:hypothetical protein
MASRQTIKDIEEALKRDIRRLTTHYTQTKTNTGTQTTYDVFSGEVLPASIKAHFYDESSNPNHIQYPRVDVRFEEISEDRESGRMISLWEARNTDYNQLVWVNQDRPPVYFRLTSGNEGITSGDSFLISSSKTKLVESGNIISILTGSNKGRYRILSVDYINNVITLDPTLISNIESISYNPTTRKLYLLDPTDLSAVKAGDVFEDANSTRFPILNVRRDKRELYLGGAADPVLVAGASILREGDVLANIDVSSVKYVIMDANRPLIYQPCDSQVTEGWITENYATPFNYHWTVEIKNKERQSHISIADRFTETVVNRTRRALEILLRTPDSAESKVIDGPSLGSANVFTVADASKMCVNDSVYLINDYGISENNQIIDIDYNTNQVMLRFNVPLSFNFHNEAVLVTQADLKLWGMYLVNGNGIMGQDSLNSFFRQEYRFRIEGWKEDEASETTQSGITEISVDPESFDGANLDC